MAPTYSPQSGAFVSVVTISILVAGVIVGIDAQFPGADVDPFPTPTTSMGGVDVGLLLWCVVWAVSVVRKDC